MGDAAVVEEVELGDFVGGDDEDEGGEDEDEGGDDEDDGAALEVKGGDKAEAAATISMLAWAKTWKPSLLEKANLWVLSYVGVKSSVLYGNAERYPSTRSGRLNVALPSVIFISGMMV